MTRSKDTNAHSLAHLLERYLLRQIDAHSQGLGYPETPANAHPYEAVPVQPVDPQLAWKDALVVASGAPVDWPVPPQWPALVNQQEPAVALAFSLGNFPQLVRNLQPLLSGEIALRQNLSGPAAQLPELVHWAGQIEGDPQRLLAAGVLRLARHFDQAAERLADRPTSPAWQALHANELAALAWHRGEGERALSLWQKQPPSAPVLFNRGMATLFLGDKEAAAVELRQAVALLPETSAWHHLGSLYLTLASS